MEAKIFSESKTECKNLMDQKVGIFRDGENLKAAVDELED